MAKVKKVRRAQDGEELCNWSNEKGGGVSCGKKGGPKTEEYKPGKMPRTPRKERIRKEGYNELYAEAREPYERDFPGDKAPSGWGEAAKNKSGTRWTTTDKGKIRYVPYSGKKKQGGKVVKKSAVKKAVVVKKSVIKKQSKKK
jgi:hypothetical protein